MPLSLFPPNASPDSLTLYFFGQGHEAAVAAMGGKFSQTVDREVMTYSATVLKGDVPKAMEVLASAAQVRQREHSILGKSVCKSRWCGECHQGVSYVVACRARHLRDVCSNYCCCCYCCCRSGPLCHKREWFCSGACRFKAG